ncbi:PREDICTED: uncharacterized protein LOC108613415 [Drosophila arizonae]|uniref:Uncharacterized protein LOC108613415 n=1 Tax=Drosophila arizonae TaxID=7263 RepID=A0ABM1P561_DROAR|nr:PREDICTED: uncharacterized protein LOC108613415 [Drosophila arizonae]
MSPAKLSSIFLIGSVLLLSVEGRSWFDFSSEDDRQNEISAEDFGRKVIIPDVERIFSSAEIKQISRSIKGTNKIKRQDSETTTKSSKHAHGMIKSMLSFVSNAMGFGRTFFSNE